MRPAPWRNGAWRCLTYHGYGQRKYRHGAGSRSNRRRKSPAAKPATTAREKAYIGALAAYYAKDGNDTAAHSRAFEQKMSEVQAAYPDDSEAAIFSRAHTLHHSAQETDKTFANQRRCGEILEPIFKKQPHHPGVAHYIIHCYDNLIDLLPFVLVRCTSLSTYRISWNSLARCRMNGRRRILTGLDLLKENANIVIDTVWLTEARSPSPEWQQCLSVFETALKCGAEWQCLVLASAAARGLAIILDEYMSDSARALQVIDEAQGVLGRTSQLLEDSRATVLLHQKRYKEALELWQEILPGWTYPGLGMATSCQLSGIERQASQRTTWKQWDVAAHNYSRQRG